MAHLGEVGFRSGPSAAAGRAQSTHSGRPGPRGRPTVNPEGRLRGGCDATPPPARRIADPSAKQGYFILQAQSKNDGARVGVKPHRGFLAYFRTVCVDEGSACAQAMQSGERIILEDVELDLAFCAASTGRWGMPLWRRPILPMVRWRRP